MEGVKGTPEGALDGILVVGARAGTSVGDVLGRRLGAAVGPPEGTFDGLIVVGARVGTSVGDVLGRRLGAAEGPELIGEAVGYRVCTFVGWYVGDRDAGAIVVGGQVGGDGDDVGFDVGLRSMVTAPSASNRSSQDTNMWQYAARVRTSAMHSSWAKHASMQSSMRCPGPASFQIGASCDTLFLSHRSSVIVSKRRAPG